MKYIYQFGMLILDALNVVSTQSSTISDEKDKRDKKEKKKQIEKGGTESRREIKLE